ncbi:MAG: cadherin-like domain-containing protein [Chloroflexota bacterium]
MTLVHERFTDDPIDVGEGKFRKIGARLFTAPDLPLPQDGFDQIPGSLFGPTIAQSRPITLAFHDGETYIDDTNGDGVDETFYVYVTENILWSRLLEVGDIVLFTNGLEGMYGLPVADCRLNAPTAFKEIPFTIDQSQLSADFGLIPTTNLVYQVDTLPLHGQLLLNNSPLSVGDQFTQEAINSQQLRYVHTTGAAEQDLFNYTVRGTVRASVSTDGVQGDGNSYYSSISGDGSRIAFDSEATTLANDPNGAVQDIFVRDLQTQETTLITLDIADGGSDGGSFSASMSTDGDYVAFASQATDLVGNSTEDCDEIPDTNSLVDVFLYQISTQEIIRESTSLIGINCTEGNGASESPSVSAYGLETVFQSVATNLNGAVDMNGFSDIFQASLITNRITPADANGASFAPVISDDGFVVAFHSRATNLIGSDDTNNFDDVFTYQNDTMRRISVHSDGSEGNGHSTFPSLSQDGRYVAFQSAATNLVDDDLNGVTDIFVHDREMDLTVRVSVNNEGDEANGSSFSPEISGNGRYITFYSEATNLAPNDTNSSLDVFVYDIVLKEISRVSIASNGTQGNNQTGSANGAFAPSISDDGDYITFDADFDNLVEGDTNAQFDVFVHYRGFSSSFEFAIEENSVYLPLIQR